MKNFDDFAKTIDDDFSKKLFIDVFGTTNVPHATNADILNFSTYSSIELLRKYHEWLNED